MVSIPSLMLFSLYLVQWGMTPVLRAARHGHTDIVDILFTSYGSSLTDVDNVSSILYSYLAELLVSFSC